MTNTIKEITKKDFIIMINNKIELNKKYINDYDFFPYSLSVHWLYLNSINWSNENLWKLDININNFEEMFNKLDIYGWDMFLILEQGENVESYYYNKNENFILLN